MPADRVVIMKLQTTSTTTYTGGKIIEVAAVKVENGKIIDVFQKFINPETEVSRAVVERTKITNKFLNN